VQAIGPVSARREVIELCPELSLQRQCELMSISRSGFYYEPVPESQENLALMRRMHDLVNDGSQFIVATHSPILLGFPGARIFVLSEDGLHETNYEGTEPYQLTRSFLEDPQRFLQHLFAKVRGYRI